MDIQGDKIKKHPPRRNSIAPTNLIISLQFCVGMFLRNVASSVLNFSHVPQ